ncbi:MAG: hypothetical protein QXN55_00505 [Candidatus Nitrosotenuis sp.]
MTPEVQQEAQVMCYKLSTGEEVLAKTLRVNDTVVLIQKPRVLIITRGQDGNVGLALAPLIKCSPDSDMFLNSEHIVLTITEANLPKEVIDSYLQEISGIQFAQTLMG